MIVTLAITGEQDWVPNPDYAVEKLSRSRIAMPNGFGFSLGELANVDFEGRGRGSLAGCKQLQVSFTIPVGFVRNLQRRTPSFEQQQTRFVTRLRKYRVSVVTDHEAQPTARHRGEGRMK
jgi:hypothetical protein